MRVILFRGKRIDNGLWIEGDLGQSSECKCYIFPENADDIFDDYEVDPETVGQFTGLADKNGVKIFEGDVIRDLHLDYITKVAYVGNQFVSESEVGIVGLFETEFYEVIANIHDNPELIK